jgi:hypothetical protein
MTDTPPQAPRRERSPSYPGIGLQAAIAKAKVVWDKEHRHAAPVSTLYRHWGYSGATGPSMTTLSALLKFGLLNDQGSGESRTAILTEDAIAILLAPSADHPDRLRAIREAALKPTIHEELWKRYGGADLPSDEAIQYYLVRERKFTETAARELIKEYRATLAFAGLPESATVSGDSEIDPPTEPEKESLAIPEEKVLTTPPAPVETAVLQTMRFPVDDTRSAVLQVPGPVTADDWDAIFDALEVFKRATLRKRPAQPPESASDQLA